MLLDLLPHFARLMPMADKYLAGKSASDKVQEAALAALGTDVRAQMGRLTEEQAGVSRQLQQQGAQIADIGVDVTRARMGVESVEERVAKLEKSAAWTVRLLLLVALLMAMTLALLVVRMVR